MKFYRSLALLIAACCCLVPGYAWDGAVTGKIQSIDVTGGNNYGVRVYLIPSSAHCNGGPNWAFLNESDSNYKVYVAALLSARALGSTVAIFTTTEGGYCHIGYINVSG